MGDLEAAQPVQEEASPWEGMVRIALMRMMADEARPECPATALHLLRPTLESPRRFFRECYTGHWVLEPTRWLRSSASMRTSEQSLSNESMHAACQAGLAFSRAAVAEKATQGAAMMTTY